LASTNVNVCGSSGPSFSVVRTTLALSSRTIR
jgi:hypothetical protein